jgi:hypothetical protein
MTKIRIALLAALSLCAFMSVSAAQARDLKCDNTLAQYTDALPQFEMLAAHANSRANDNPLYISDAEYYASVVRDARQCIQTLTPLTTAAR